MNSILRLDAMTIVILSLLFSVTAFSQSATETDATDSVKVDTLVVRPTQVAPAESAVGKPQPISTGEIVLEEIKIEAIVETPSVAIVPKRLKPDFGKMEFVDRSFEKELKAIPKKPMLNNSDLNGVNKIKTNKPKDVKSKE